MSARLRSAAVRLVKPRVGDRMWARLRALGGGSTDAGLGTGRQGRQGPRERRRERLARMDLTELAQEFGTDKFGSHRYTPHYQRHLEHLRDREFTLLEIGIGGSDRAGKGGASLRMWKHFFPHAQIVGLDLHDKSFVAAERITPIQGDQADEALLRRIEAEHGPFQVVVDDGSHRPEHVRETFRVLFPLLAADGVYAIEDTQTSYWPEWGGSEDRHDPTTTMALVKDLLDGLHHEEFVEESYEPSYSDLHVVGVHGYHNLVVVEKGDNREGSNKRRILKARYGRPGDAG
jgi:demethylmacrocin O-methyltransferase